MKTASDHEEPDHPEEKNLTSESTLPLLPPTGRLILPLPRWVE